MREFKKGHLSTEFWFSLSVAFVGVMLIVVGWKSFRVAMGWPDLIPGGVGMFCGSFLLSGALGAYCDSRASVKAAATSPTPLQGRGSV